jgi:hypothetical protein
MSPDALKNQSDVAPSSLIEKRDEGGASVLGFCPKENVVQPIAARTEDIQGCYEKQLKRHRKLAGTVELSWTLGKDGRVATIESTGLEEVAPCIKDVMRSIAFPPPNHGCETVSGMKFAFQPG